MRNFHIPMAKRKKRVIYALLGLVGVLALLSAAYICWDFLEHPFFSSPALNNLVGALINVATILGVILLVVELKSTKEVAMAEFITNLNDRYVSSEIYTKVYTMLDSYDFNTCPKLDLAPVEVSHYLTFFEVFCVLMKKGMMEFEQIDDLFAYRFFIAVHNPEVQRIKLTGAPENFKNLYILEKKWMEYRRKTRQGIFREDYCLEKAVGSKMYHMLVDENYRPDKKTSVVLRDEDITYAPCTEKDLPAILELQALAFKAMPSETWLRRNSPEALRACLRPPHVTLGAYTNGRLIAFITLFFGEETKENLGYDFGVRPEELPHVANLKLVIVHPHYRGNRLQLKLSRLLEETALERGVKILCATASPDNVYSVHNLQKQGYKIARSVVKYEGYRRLLFYKFLKDEAFAEKIRRAAAVDGGTCPQQNPGEKWAAEVLCGAGLCSALPIAEWPADCANMVYDRVDENELAVYRRANSLLYGFTIGGHKNWLHYWDEACGSAKTVELSRLQNDHVFVCSYNLQKLYYKGVLNEL